MLYTSFVSSNIELSESEVKMGVASSRGLPCPLKCDYLLRATNSRPAAGRSRPKIYVYYRSGNIEDNFYRFVPEFDFADCSRSGKIEDNFDRLVPENDFVDCSRSNKIEDNVDRLVPKFDFVDCSSIVKIANNLTG